MPTLTLPARKSPLQGDRFGRLILRQFRGQRPPKEIEEAFAKAVQLSEKKAVLERAKKLAAGYRLKRLQDKGLAGKWAESVLKEKSNGKKALDSGRNPSPRPGN